jgi:predicted RNA polymerase sigma factor
MPWAAMVHGPKSGLDMIERLEGNGLLAGNHRLDTVKAHLLEMAGAREAAIERYLTAARLTISLPERRYLERQATRLARESSSGH